MNKVECYNDPELDKVFPQKWPCHVVIATNEGRSYQARVEYPKGDPENSLTWEELIAKFENVTQNVCSAAQKQALVEQVKNLENLETVKPSY